MLSVIFCHLKPIFITQWSPTLIECFLSEKLIQLRFVGVYVIQHSVEIKRNYNLKVKAQINIGWRHQTLLSQLSRFLPARQKCMWSGILVMEQRVSLSQFRNSIGNIEYGLTDRKNIYDLCLTFSKIICFVSDQSLRAFLFLNSNQRHFVAHIFYSLILSIMWWI